MKFAWLDVIRALSCLMVGVLACAVTLLCMAPANWITPYLAQASNQRIQLIDATGSLWHGEASLMLSAGTDTGALGANALAPTLLPGRVTWRTAFWPLWQGRLHTEIFQTSAMPHSVELNLGLHQASLTGGSLMVPATLLAGLGSPFNTLDLKGDMRLDWTPCQMRGDQVYGQLNLTLSDLSSRLARVSPLGSYRLEGHGQATSDNFTFDGTARAAEGFSDGLTGLLNILGTPRGDGIYSMRTMP